MGDSGFTGNIPEFYERDLVPLLFQPWADLIADRLAAFRPGSILETAAGTGVLTRAMVQRCPGARIVATDLNAAMLDVARDTLPPEVELVVADATALPFDDGAFDALAGQFGIMFYPDRAKGYREAVRVLRPGGTMIAAVWGSLEANPVSNALHQAMAEAFPDDPPRFLGRTPFAYFDAGTIIDETEEAGFDTVAVEELTFPHPPVDPALAAEGMCLGSPLRAEIEERGPGALDKALAAARTAVARFAGKDGRIDAEMTALIITASR